MEAIVKELYVKSIDNQEFKDAMLSADGDKHPSRFFADSNTKTLWASMYYGWLVAKYGDNWKLHL